MSIARREALSRYPKMPRPTDVQSADYQLRDFQARAEELRRGQMRVAYVYARTAEPTEEEVKAVADELAAWNFDVAMNSGATIHGASADFSSRSFELLAKRVLTAARKAVTE
jgi:cystathionine beta-lyase/cystathionine gamma-synthase